MKQAKQRVVAIDYFRGIFILMVVINHAAMFTTPYAYLFGYSNLWTSAAEMFLIVSGVTLGIVRGDSIKSDFKNTAYKIWRNARTIYFAYIASVLALLVLALFFASQQLPNYIPGNVPSGGPLANLLNLLTLRTSFGAASFLVVFPPFLLLAPLALYASRTRYWSVLLAGSIVLFLFNTSVAVTPQSVGLGTLLGMWQLYFVAGLIIAHFRVTILGWFYGLRAKTSRRLSSLIFATSAIILGASTFLNFNLYPTITKLTYDGWLPLKAQHAYLHLLHHKPLFDQLFMNARIGVLRPMIAFLFLAALYLLYQQNKEYLLRRTGNFIMALGRNSLWIFIAQAFAIPILAVLPIKHGSLLPDTLLTATLVALIWSIAQRNLFLSKLRVYFSGLRTEYNEAKQAAMYRGLDDAV